MTAQFSAEFMNSWEARSRGNSEFYAFMKYGYTDFKGEFFETKLFNCKNYCRSIFNIIINSNGGCGYERDKS